MKIEFQKPSLQFLNQKNQNNIKLEIALLRASQRLAITHE